jgi:predicted RNase H-like HicB family nuclease
MPVEFEYTSWEADGGWLGYVRDFPDVWTQGESFQDLIEHLKDLHAELTPM